MEACTNIEERLLQLLFQNDRFSKEMLALAYQHLLESGTPDFGPKKGLPTPQIDSINVPNSSEVLL